MISNLFTGSGIGPTIFYLSISIFVGLLLGKIKVKGISLGITWVLFVGILISALGVSLNQDMLHVIKELGLIFFVTGVGIQVGPGFFKAFRKGGLKLNLLAVSIVILGVLTTIVISKVTGESLAVMAGVYTGAITNTPGMSAAQQTVAELGIVNPDMIATGYAMAYPLAVVGLIVTCILVRPICRIKLDKEPVTATVDDSAKLSKDRGASRLRLIPIFVIIGLGILIGSIPIPVGMAAPVKLGLAGGPLVVALLVSWYAVKKGWFGTEFTESQGIHMLREVGIALFLAAVGLGAGGSFVSTLAEGGYLWVLYGFIITMVPELTVAIIARLVFKVNYYTLMGMIGGATTDPPVLAFANNVAPEGCKLPDLGYATVYPLTMFLRIFSAQLLVLLAV